METVTFAEMKDGTKDDCDWMLLFKTSEPNDPARLADRVLDMLQLMQGPTCGAFSRASRSMRRTTRTATDRPMAHGRRT